MISASAKKEGFEDHGWIIAQPCKAALTLAAAVLYGDEGKRFGENRPLTENIARPPPRIRTQREENSSLGYNVRERAKAT